MDLSDETRKARIRRGILDPIDLLIQRGHVAAAAMLILAGIDAMANVNRQDPAKDVDAKDFKQWVDRYFLGVGRKGKSPNTSAEWYMARCMMPEELAGSRQACIRTRLNELVVHYHVDTA